MSKYYTNDEWDSYDDNDWDEEHDYEEVRPSSQRYRRRRRNSPQWLKYVLICLGIVLLLNFIFKRCSIKIVPQTGNTVVSGDTVGEQKSLSYYYYNQLNRVNKNTYTDILNAMLNMDAQVRIEEVDKDTMAKVVEAIMLDHPELFWCSGAYNYMSYDTYSEFKPTYLYGEQERNTRQTQIDVQAKNILSQIESGWTDYEKIKYVFESIIQSVEYVTGSPDNQNIYSSLVNKKSVCAGYARATQYLLQQMGIECLFVPGMVDQTESHAWNIVKCNGSYYQVDTTFGDRAFETNTQSNMPEEFNTNYGYLCISDSEMYADRYSTTVFELPTCNLVDLNYFKMQGCYYEYYSDAVLQGLRTAIFNGEKMWKCQFSNPQDYQTMVNALKNGAFVNIVSDYWTSIGSTGQFMTWYVNHDKTRTIVFWY